MSKPHPAPASGHALLEELCTLRSPVTARDLCSGGSPFTPRVRFIHRTLASWGLPVELDCFQPVPGTPDAVPGRPSLVNLLVRFAGSAPRGTRVFLAHHDVVNLDSENCQDNSASVANLLELCHRLSLRPPEDAVVVAFVDGEELAAPHACGSARLAQQIHGGQHGQVLGTWNLELTAGGSELIIDAYGSSPVHAQVAAHWPSLHPVPVPANDAQFLTMNGVPSACLCLLTPEMVEEVRERGWCRTWTLCHRADDTFARSAVREDMTRLVDLLERVA